MSAGESGFPPTQSIGEYSVNTKINGKYVQLQGVTKYAAHTNGVIVHSADDRIVVTGSNTMNIEGHSVGRIGDMLLDGDTIATGSSDTNIG